MAGAVDRGERSVGLEREGVASVLRALAAVTKEATFVVDEGGNCWKAPPETGEVLC